MEALLLSYQKTGKVPPALQARPEITQDVGFYIECFYFLSRFRSSSGFGPNPLSLLDIETYARKIGYTTTEDFLFFAEVMNSCDQVYLDDVQKRQEAKRKTVSKPTTPRAGRR